MKNLKKAIREWTANLGAKRVILDASVLKQKSTATFRSTQQVLGVLKPKTVKEVSAIMKIATKREVPVYAVSAGKNWGLGSKVPQRDSVLVDLTAMNKIIELNEEMGYITVEPGVTFQQVEAFLSERKSSLMLDSIGSTPQASIIGNTAERGHGMALYADRFNFVCGMEVVLPDGTVIHTGFQNFEGSKLGRLAKWGVGPYLDGLFTQSNFGIITQLTLWLRKKPSNFQSFIFHIDDEAKLSQLIDRWRAMELSGFNASLRIFNDIRMIAFGQRFPEAEEKPLSDKARKMLRDKLKIGKWIGIGGLYSLSERHADADKAYVLENVAQLVDSIKFYDQAYVDKTYSDADQGLRAELDFMFNRSLLRGFTSTAGINMTYWRKPTSVTVSDIHDDSCGVIWYCPAIPFIGRDVRRAITIGETVCRKYGFELNIGFLFVTERTLDITGALCYDRSVKGEDKRAMDCHKELMEQMVKEGYSPYRLGIQSMNLMKHQEKNTRKLLTQLKSSIDPAHVLAGGHYIE